MSKILIVEDDRYICTELAALLRNADYEAEILEDFANAAECILAARADLILLDINIPYVNGELLLKRIRRETDIPVIMLTSRCSEADEVLSMSYGADDYITKPFNPTILLLRISAILRRYHGGGDADTYRGCRVNTAKGTLSSDTGELVLTKNEMIIFRLLLERQGEIVTRDELMTALWDNDEFVNDNALTVNVSRLRGKLSDFGCTDAIETRKKQGYILK